MWGLRFKGAEEKTESMKARSLSSGRATGQGGSGGFVGDVLEKELNKAKASGQVEAELAKLKEEMKR